MDEDYPQGQPVEKKDKKEKGPTAHKKLFDYVRDRLSVWRTTNGDPYADVNVDGKTRTWAFAQPNIDAWLRVQYQRMTHDMDIPTQHTIDTVHKHLESMALVSDAVFKPHLRVARADQKIYYDLHNDAGTIVTIDSKGWSVTPKNGTKFISGDGMMSQVNPAKFGDLNLLRKYISVEKEDDYRLIVAWIIAALVSPDAYPLLILNGGQGTAKSSITSILQRIVDPRASERREPPKEAKDVGAIAKNSYVLAFDNLQRIPEWMSDTFCRLSTGGTIGGRAYYTLHRDSGFEAMRPTILNGIPQFVEMADLMERSVLLTLPTIPEHRRRSWEDMERDFERDRPFIVGAFFDLIVQILALYPTVHLKKLPRLAGWAKHMAAAEVALGWGMGEFARLWEVQTQLKSQEIIGSNSLAQAIINTMDDLRDRNEVSTLRGNMRELMNKIILNYAADEKAPSNPRAFASMLRRVQPDLERQGINVINNGRDKHGTRYEIRYAKS